MKRNCFYTKTILAYIDDLICNGYKKYDDLLDSDKNKLVIMCMDVLGDDCYSFIIDHKDYDVSVHFLKDYMLTGKLDSAVTLVNRLRKNALEYGSDILNDIFAERFEEYEEGKLNENPGL